MCMGAIKDKLEDLDEFTKLLEQENFRLSKNLQEQFFHLHGDIQKAYSEFQNTQFVLQQQIEFIKAEIKQTNSKIDSINTALDSHHDRLHKIEIKDNMELLDSDKHEICVGCSHKIKDCSCSSNSIKYSK